MTIYLFICTVLLICTVHVECVIVESIRFSNKAYTGYISENIGQLNPSQLYPSEPSKRHYEKIDPNKKSVYVRFVDQTKPSVVLGMKNAHHCLAFNFKTLNLSLKTDDYDQDAISLFEIDHNNYLCTKSDLNCLCYFQIRLTDDPFVRDRINREAKDKYTLSLQLNDTKASLVVNILDDNDLEPMFDPSEYTIELKQFDAQFQLANLAQFSVIGKVNALDPDLAENARINYYSTNSAYFGVLPNTGEIYLKKSSSHLFALNSSELSLRVKAFDAGIKLNLANNLARMNASLFDNLQDRDALDKRVVDMVANLDQHQIDLVSKYLDQVKSFELAQVNVVLSRNLVELFEQHFSYPVVEKVSETTTTKVLYTRLVPLRILKFAKEPDLNRLRILGDHSDMFELEAAANKQVFVSFIYDPNLIQNETNKYKIVFCQDHVCIDLVEFEINFLLDLNVSVGALCELSLAVAQNSEFKVNKMTVPGTPLFDAGPVLGPSNLCRSVTSLLDFEITLNNNLDQHLALGQFYQVLVNKVSPKNQTYELVVRARLKNLSPLGQKSVTFVLSYSDVCDFLSLSFSYRTEIDTAPAPSTTDILYLSLKSKNGIYTTNVDRFNRSNFVQDYSEAYLILGANLDRLLIVNSFINELIRVKINSQKSPSQNLLGIFSQPVSSLNISVHTSDPLDSKCFYVDHFYGSLYLKCQLLASFGHDQKFTHIKPQVYHRHIHLYHNNSKLLASIQLEFNVEEELTNVQDVSIQIEPVKIKFMTPSTTIDEHLNTTQLGTKMKAYVKKVLDLKQQSGKLAKVSPAQNETTIHFEYEIKNSKDCVSNTELFQVEANRSGWATFFNLTDDTFYIDAVTGVVKFKSNFRPDHWLHKHLFRLKLQLLETNFLANNSRFYDLEIILKPRIESGSDLIQVPKLIRKKYELVVDETSVEKSNDLLLIKSFDVLPSKHQFNVSYSLTSHGDVPFYLDLSGRLFYFNTLSHARADFSFQVHLKFRFSLNQSVECEEIAVINVHMEPSYAKMDFFADKLDPIVTFNLNVPMHTSAFVQLEKSLLVGFVTLTDAQIRKYLFDIDEPVFVYNAPSILFIDQEQNLINENFLKLIQIDEHTGAIYFNPEQINSITLCHRLSKLVHYFFYGKSQASKVIELQVTVKNTHTSLSLTARVNLIFHSSPQAVWIPNGVDALGQHNTFRINTNNLLNLFRNGDEFLLPLDIEENSPTWPAYLEYHESDREGFLVNLRDYFKARLNSDSKTSLINFELLKNTRFYLPNDRYFQIVDNYNGLVQTKHSIQFDYEIEQSYTTKILVVQYRDSVDVASNQENDLVFKSEPSHFSYYLDLAIRVVNVVDEPFVTSEPVYYISVDENEAKNKQLFTIALVDFDRGSHSIESRFSAEIISGNIQGHFYVSGLTLFTSASARKLNREAQSKHELQIKIVENGRELNSSRFALCRIVVNVEDVNDHRPIVNDIELDIYDQLDALLVKRIPIANAIAIDQDSVSQLKYVIVSVRISAPFSKQEQALKRAQLTNIQSLFALNSTSGALSISQAELPCHSCSLVILYRALDIGRFKNRTSRKSYIRLNVLPRRLTNASTFELSLTPEKTHKKIVLNLNEDIKLGEKVYQVKTNVLSHAQKSIVYYNLLEESNVNLTFYMSNHDGSLYLIKKLDADNGVQFYNLSVLITNWQGQVENVFIEVFVRDTNDNRPEFSANLVYLNETIQVDTNMETSIDLIEAMDRDAIDQNKLQFKMQDCFYLSHDILLKKPFIASAGIGPSTNHLNYPLCSKQFLALVPSPSIGKSQLLKLKINTLELKNYLDTSSDMFSKTRGSILFVIDLSVRDTSPDLATFTRLMLNFTIEKQSTLIFKRQLIADSIARHHDTLDFGFRKKDYTVVLQQSEQLKKGAKLISLFNEFVWAHESDELFSFKPYEISFGITNNDSLFSLDKNFALLTLNESIREMNTIYEVDIEAKTNLTGLEKSKFFKQTKVYVSILRSASIEASTFPVLQMPLANLTGFIDENVPVGSYVLNRPSGDEFVWSSALNLDHSLYSINFVDQTFAFEPDSGLIKTKLELDYERQSDYLIRFTICLVDGHCFDKQMEILVKIVNRNDNEPAIRPLSSQLLLLNRSDLIRSMTLYTFRVQDMDKNLTELDLKIFQKTFFPSGGCSDAVNWDMSEMLAKHHSENAYALKLSDLGYEYLLFIAGKNHCSAQIEVIIQATDGLFMTLSNFSFIFRNEENVVPIMRIKSNPIAPILHTIELSEGRVEKSEILNIELVLDNYLKSRKFPTKTPFNFSLLNHEDLFYICGSRLHLDSSVELDREQKDTYELFIGVGSTIDYNVPKNIRVLVKINDVNDNRPIFVQPAELQYTRTKLDLFDLYEYNVSCLRDQLLQSTQLKPLLQIKAKDDDLAQNASLLYTIKSNFKGLIISSDTGSVYYTAQSDQVPSLIELNVTARDQGSPYQESKLKVRLNVVNSTQGVYFRTTFYSFKLNANDPVNTTIGHVNSATFYEPVESRLIYSLADGDELQQFHLNPLSGRLSLRKELTWNKTYHLLVEARSEFEEFGKASTWVRIEIEGSRVPKLQFERFEYLAYIDENQGKMSEIIRLQTSDPNANFKLLNNYDLFYINELTGSVFNKQLFDFESEQKEFGLKVKAYNSAYETYCILVVKVVNRNDNKPLFDKNMFLSEIELNSDSDYAGPLEQILMNSSCSTASNATHQFVTKIAANDLDFDPIEYTIVSQSALTNSLDKIDQLIESTLFSMDSGKGFVFLNKKEFFKFRKIFKFLNAPMDSDVIGFGLKIGANDSKFVTTAQLNIQIKQFEFSRPEFKTSCIQVSLDYDKYLSKSNFMDLSQHLKEPSNRINFKTWSAGFMTSNGWLSMDKDVINSVSVVYVAVFVCDRDQTGLCDQALIELNLTCSEPLVERPMQGPVMGFVSQYGVSSIQQQYSAADYNYLDFVNEYDYYIYEELNDANERFYYELKTYELPEHLRYQFDIVECQFEMVNWTISNSTLTKQLRKFSQSRDKFSFTPIQIKHLFLLNKNNGVLSSRKTINSMNPGVYNFDVSLKVLSKNGRNETIGRLVDNMKFRLVVLPTISSLEKQINKNDFKFEREFYRFKFDKLNPSIGSVRLVPKFNKSLNFSVNYKLIGNKFNLQELFVYHEAELGVKETLSMDTIKPYLNENKELYLNCLCFVSIEGSTVELMKEIVIDFTTYLDSGPKVKLSIPSDSLIFTEFNEKIKIFDNLPIGTAIFKLMVTNRLNSDIVFSTESRYFDVDPTSGLLSVNTLATSRLNVTACNNGKCVHTQLDVELMNAHSRDWNFDIGNQNGVIREDALPGTVVTTLAKTEKKIEYFIIDGDEFNQFDISPDAKVYTRRMLDKEQISNYTLTIMAFDGMFKSTTSLFVNVLNVDDSAPVCHDNLVNLKLAENLPLHQVVHVPNITSTDQDSALVYQIISDFESEKLIESVPFKFNQNTKKMEVDGQLDHETRPYYTFYLLSSLNKISRCMIKYAVEVVDVNDNRPEFNAQNKTISVNEHSPKGLILDLDMFTTDLDSTNNSVVYYSITNDTYFSIDKTNGLIQINSQNLDREVLGNQIKLDIWASNLDNLTSVYSLNVNIIDLNDNKPVFEQKEYFITIPENLPLNYEIGKMRAHDADLNSRTEYYVRSGDKFYIDRQTGAIFLNHSVDYEKEKEFVLEIVAVDAEMSIEDNNSSCLVTISVLDVNDNPPIFDPTTPKHVTIDENLPPNSTIVFTKAYDLDQSDLNNKVSYHLVNGSHLFEIEEKTGRLYTTDLIDYEEMTDKTFHIMVQCKDNGEPELKSYLTLKITVQDLNDNEPVFVHQNQTLVLKDSFPIGNEITKFVVSDKDSFGHVFTFSIMEQYKQAASAKIYLSEKLFFMKENSLILSKNLLSNQTYGLRIRCYDSGLPSPLFSDTYVTIIVTDESSTVPSLNDTTIQATSIDHFAPITQNQVIGQLRASDADKDILFFESNSDIIDVNQLNGLIRIKEDAADSQTLIVNPRVTDKKFVVEAKLNVNLNRVKSECLFNSLYAKFITWHSDDKFSAENFVQMGHLGQINSYLQRMVVLRRKSSFNLTIEIIGLRVEPNLDHDIFDFGLDENLFDSKSSLIEVLFIVKKTTYKSIYSSCINSKYMSRFLNKKKPILIKQLKSNTHLNMRLKDLSYNTKCSTFHDQICSINIQLQTCRLNFNGFNRYDLCDTHANMCYLLPNYDWTCESNSKLDTATFSQECAKNMCQNNGLCKIVKKFAKRNNMTKHRVHCFCPNGFKGKHCEQDVNECTETGVRTSQWINPCHPSANCINTQGSYICNCSLEPSSLCYNTLSPQYTASMAAFKIDKHLKYSNSFKQFKFENVYSNEDDDFDLHDQVTMLGYRIPNHVIQQALLGIFGGICAILVLLSLAAAIMCKINFSKGYIEAYEVRHDAMTSSTSVDHDDFTSSTSSPGSFKMEPKKPTASKYKAARFNRNKQRSSMTASLISSNTVESSDGEQIQRKNFRYRINNLFFSKNQNLRGLPEANKEESEIESSSAYSPKSLTQAKYKIDLKGSVLESNGLLKHHDNDGDDEDESKIAQGLVRPVDTFGRSSFKTKYNTLDLKKERVECEMEKIKFNTAIKRPKGKEVQSDYSTFLPKLPKQLTENALETDKDSVASAEDSCLGFYWDITDWAGNIDQLNDSKTFLPVPSNLEQQNSASLSPIYSRVFKINKVDNLNDEKTTQFAQQDLDTLNDDSLNFINEKLDAQKTDTYMYLTREDCDKTAESIKTQTNTESNCSVENTEEDSVSNHCFAPSTFKSKF